MVAIGCRRQLSNQSKCTTIAYYQNSQITHRYQPPNFQYYIKPPMKRNWDHGSKQEDQQQPKCGHINIPIKKSLGQPQPYFKDVQMYIRDPKTIDILRRKEIFELLPIQQASFFQIYSGFDVLATDKPASGKTLAYLLPIFQRFRKIGLFKNTRGIPKMIIILPTKQLVIQVSHEISTIKHSKKQFTVGEIYGTKNYLIKRIKAQQNYDILVGTPHSIMDLHSEQMINLESVSVLCFQYIDQMLKMGLEKDLEKVVYEVKLNKSDMVQTILFSTSVSDSLKSFCQKNLKKDHRVLNTLVSQDEESLAKIKHYKFKISKLNKSISIKNIVQKLLSKQGYCLVFCETKLQTIILQQELSNMLRQPIIGLHKDVCPQKRLRTFQDMKKGSLRLVVTTNVVCKGISIPNIQLIIQCSPPKDVDSYNIRSQKIGKTDQRGTIVTLFQQSQEYFFKKIQYRLKIDMDQLILETNAQNKEPKIEQSKSPSTMDNQQFAATYDLINDYISSQNCKVEYNPLAQFVIEGWRKVNATPMQLSEYIKSVIDVCPVKTSINSSSFDKVNPCKILFAVPQIHENYIMKMSNQFKTDGYKVSKLQTPNSCKIGNIYV